MSMFDYSEENKSSSQPLFTNLFEQIQRDILSGKIKSGEKLTEQKICDKYNVSRTPVREALRQLEVDGLIENIPNRGAFAVGFSKQDIIDMFDLRRTYEVQAVKWAIERISDDQMSDLEETFEFMEFYTMKQDAEKMLNINSNFHHIIYAATGNRLLQQLLSSYQIYVKYSTVYITKENNYLPVVLEEHKAIFEAFKNRDTEAGSKAMADHMLNSKLRRFGDE